MGQRRRSVQTGLPGRRRRRTLRILAVVATLVAAVLTVGPPPVAASSVPGDRIDFGITGPGKLGEDMDVDGRWAIVGAPTNVDAVGEAYILERTTLTNNWTIVQTLTTNAAGTGFGRAVTINGDYAAVGTTSGVEIFERPAEGSPFAFVRSHATQKVGALDLQEDALLAGFELSPGPNGVATVYERGTAAPFWDEALTYTLPSPSTVHVAVAITPGLSETAPFDDDIFVYVGNASAASQSGEVYVYKKSNGVWDPTLVETLTDPAGPSAGGTDFFGRSLDADGTRLFVGEPLHDGGGVPDIGAVWVYEGDHGNFGTPQQLVADSTSFSDALGLDLDWDPASRLLAVGSPAAVVGSTRSGEVVIFDGDASYAIVDTVSAYDPVFDDQLGHSVAISSEGTGAGTEAVYLLAGAIGVDISVGATTETGAGAIYPFTVVEPEPPDFKLTSGDGPLGDDFGQSVALVEGSAVIGNPEGDTDDGKVEVFVRPSTAVNDYVLDQVLTAQLIGEGFGATVAADGDRIAVGYRTATQIDVWSRSGGPGTVFTLDRVIATADPVSSIDIDGDNIVVGSSSATTGQLFDISGAVTTSITVNPAGSGAVSDVALSETTMVFGAGTGAGIVTTFAYNSGTGAWDPADILSNPDAALPTAGVGFGQAVDIDGDTLAVGANDSEIAPFSGAVWVYPETTPGSFGAPTKLKAAVDVSNGFGSSVHVDGDIIAVGTIGQGNGPGLNGRTGGAALIKRNPDTGIWTVESTFQAPDRTVFDQFYGASVTVLGEDVVIGAPGDANVNGAGAGAAYTYKTSVPTGVVDNPSVIVSVTPGSPTAPAGATGISVVDLPPTAIEGYGGSGSNNIVGTSLNAVDGAATPADPSEVLAETTIADLGLDGGLLDGILLSDVVIEGGWEPVLAGTIYDGVPLQNVTLGEVIALGLIDSASLETVDLSATPIGAIPIGAIAVADTTIGDLPLPGGQTWCDLLLSISPGYNCTTSPAADPNDDTLIDLAIQGTPIGAIPIGAIPIGAIPIGAIPIGAIPIGAIEIEGSPIGAIPVESVPIGAIPIGAIPIGAIPIGAIPIGAIDIGATPIGAIPIGAITIGDVPLGDLTANGGIEASPIGAIPIGAIDVAGTPIGAIPIGAIPIGAIPIGAIPIGAIDIEGTPIGAIPIGAIDVAGTPIGAIPIGAIGTAATPIGAIPIGAIDIGTIPIGAIPIGAIPIGAIPIGAIPIGAIDLAASPIGAIPIGAIPAPELPAIVDCELIDCDPAAGFTLADAADANALVVGGTLAALEGVDTGADFADLVGIDGLDEAAIRAQIDGQTSVTTLAQFLTFDDMILAELPIAGSASTPLADLGDALATVSLADLLAAVTGGDETDLRNQLAAEGVDDLEDLDNRDGIELGDLPTTDANFAAQTVALLLPAMEGIRLGDLLSVSATYDETDINWGTATAEDVSDWQDVTLEELATYNGTSLAQLITQLVLAGNEGDLSFGDLLLSLIGTEAYDWAEVDLGAIDLESTTAPVTITSSFEIDGNGSIPRTVFVTTTLPTDAAYVPGTAQLSEISTNLSPSGFGEPVVDGNQLTWTLTGAGVGGAYLVSVDIAPSLSLGTSVISTEVSLAASGVSASAVGSIGIAQAFEPNDQIGDSGILTAVSDTIYASHIGTETDVDLYRVDLVAGSRLAVSLSDLPADYDLVVYGPPSAPVSDQPVVRQINPTEPPEVTLEAASNDSGGAVLQDLPLITDLPVIDVSNNRDTEGEAIDIASVRNTGTYYVQVSGYSGATSPDPYALFVKTVDPPAPLVCAAQDYQSAADVGTLPSTASLAGVNTIILVNRERLFGKYGTDATTVLTALDDLVSYTNTTNPGLGITAAIVPVDGDANVRAAYNVLDGAACEPDNANAVVREINRVIDDVRDADPATEITHIMVVGDDDVIPMARLADDTTIANETGYAQTFLGSDANSFFGALVNGFYLSDEPYGDVDPIQSGDRILHVTDTALGRMVETPTEIAGQVAAFIGSGGQLDPSTGLVTGYDFLDDGSQAVADSLTALPDTTSVDTIISETWTAGDVIDELFPATGPSPQVASINAHYDHYRALPADQNAAGTEEDLFTTADVDDPARAAALLGRIVFSMGCHGGLHVPDELFATGDPRALDWAQVYARQSATWVANTGYGYGETEGVELSERLMALYAERLDGSVTAGEALFYAKQTYLGTQQAEYGPFDEKVLQEATFYGIPFYEVSVTTPPPPAPLPPQPTTSPVPGTGLEVSSISADPSFQPSAAVGQGTSYTASVPSGDPGVPDQQSTPFAPIAPTVSYDVSYVDANGDPVRVAQGALITGLTTNDISGIDPDLALPIVDDSAVETEPEVGDINTDPALFVSAFNTPEGARQALTALLGTFSSDQPDGSGTQRLYEEIELDVYYRAVGDDADQVRPQFTSVDSTIEDGILVIDAVVVDDVADNIQRVLALVVEDAGTDTEWTPVELVKQADDRWSGSLAVSGTEIEYLAQAVDGSGNTALTTNKARLFAEDPTEPPADPTITVNLSGSPANPPFFNTAVTVTATAGGIPLDYRVNGGELIVAGTTASVVLDPAVLGDGAHVVEFIAGDVTVSETVLFDTTAPTVTIVSPADGGVYPSNEPVLVDFSCADAASGIAACTALLGGAPVDDGDLVNLTPGVYVFDLTGTDTVGNVTTDSVTFEVTAVGDAQVIELFTVDGIALAGQEVQTYLEFTGDGTHTAVIDWGDGTTCDTSTSDPGCSLSEPANGDPGEISGAHTYAGPGGAFTVSVTLTSTLGDSETVSRVLPVCTILGTSGPDVLNGTGGDDVICGLGGNDVLRGNGGDDILIGGAGRDTLFGGDDDDLLIGNASRDVLFGQRGNDELRGGQGNDRMVGGSSGDLLIGGGGRDELWGGTGDDVIHGNGGDDKIIGASGADEAFGGRGDDRLAGWAGVDLLVGGSGADVLDGGGSDDDLRGGVGDDILRGGSGVDTLDGGDDTDKCQANGGADVKISCES